MSTPPCARRLAVALLLIIAPVAAAAHAHLRRSAPAAGAHLAEPPRELRLTFSEPPSSLALARLMLVNARGDTAALTAPVFSAADRATIVSAVVDTLGAGAYTVHWQIAGDDGHPTRGAFAFTVDARAAISAAAADSSAATQAPAEPPPASEDTSLAESPAAVVARWLTYAGLLGAVGAVAFALVVLPRVARGPHAALVDAARSRAAPWGATGVGLLCAGAALRLSAQRAATGVDLTPLLTNTVWGWGWSLQVAAALVALTGFTRRRWRVAAVGAAVLALTPALSGHAAASETPAVTLLADALHVAGAAGWLGTLLVIFGAGIPAAAQLPHGERGGAVLALVQTFSPLALVCGGLVALSGTVLGVTYVGSVGALSTTAYGQALLWKLGAVVLVAAVGAYNWQVVTPSLGRGAGDDARRMRRSAAVELALTAFVLAVTAVLVARPTPAGEAMASVAAVPNGQ